MQKSSYRVFHTPIDLGSRLVYTDSYDTYLPVGAPNALHYHDLCEVGVCREGRGLWFIGGRAYALSPGDAVVVKAGVPHYSRSVGNVNPADLADVGDCRCEFIYFDEYRLFEESGIKPIEFGIGSDCPPVFYRRENKLARELLLHMVDAVRQGGEFCERRAAHWYALFLLNLPLAEAETVAERDSELAPALDRMAFDFAENLTLDMLAAECAMSPSWFSKRFKAEYGVTPMRYLNWLRVDIAAQLLLSGVSVTEAGILAGFSSPSELYRHFRERYGIAPSEYRRGDFGVEKS